MAPERHSNRQLAGARRHHESHDADDAERRQDQHQTAGDSHGDGLRHQIAQALVDEVLSGHDAGERHTGQRLDAQLAERGLQGRLQLRFVARRAARDEKHRRAGSALRQRQQDLRPHGGQL